MGLRRIFSIFEKDIKEFFRNGALLTLPIVPIVLALVYNRISGGDIPLMLRYLIIGTGLASVTTSMIMTMIADENEKGTLRNLILSPASWLEILVGKSLAVFTLSIVTLVISFAIIGTDGFFTFKVLLGLTLLFLFFLFLGIGLGLHVKSVSAVSAYIMPVLFIFGFTPMIEVFGLPGDHLANQIAHYLPLSQMIELHEQFNLSSSLILICWTLVAFILMQTLFRKVTTD